MKKKIVIFGLIMILILPVFSQHSTGLTKKENILENTNNKDLGEIEEMVTIQLQTYGLPHDASIQKKLPYSQIDHPLLTLRIYILPRAPSRSSGGWQDHPPAFRAGDGYAHRRCGRSRYHRHSPRLLQSRSTG